MTTEFIDLLLKQSPLIVALCIGAYILWTRYDKFTQRNYTKLEEMEKRMHSYMESDRKQLIVMAEMQQRIITDNTEAMKCIQRSMDRHTKIMECVMTEIKEAREQRKTGNF